MANGTAITTKQKDFNNNNSLPDVTNKSGDELLAAMWGLDPNKIKQVSNISKVYFSKHGMFASIPILCKVDGCHYKDVCMVDPSQRILGTRCPMEIAALITRYNQWCQHFNINIDGDAIDAKDLVDATLIKDLVNIEIQIDINDEIMVSRTSYTNENSIISPKEVKPTLKEKEDIT